VKVPCPPAVPIVLSGERIDARCIAVCEAYGITEISVVQ
jgi:arginine/lysine/ornithine decarboxylase